MWMQFNSLNLIFMERTYWTHLNTADVFTFRIDRCFLLSIFCGEVMFGEREIKFVLCL